MTRAKKNVKAVKSTKKVTVENKKVVKKAVKIAKKSKKASPIPKGYHNATPYLIVDNAKAAIEFYKKAFGAKEIMRLDSHSGKVMHAQIKIGDSQIMLGDACPEKNAKSPTEFGGSPVSIYLYMKNVDAVMKSAVSAGAKVIREAEDMFYGDRSGGLRDPFGHQWYVATHIEDVTTAQIKKRAAALFAPKK